MIRKAGGYPVKGLQDPVIDPAETRQRHEQNGKDRSAVEVTNRAYPVNTRRTVNCDKRQRRISAERDIISAARTDSAMPTGGRGCETSGVRLRGTLVVTTSRRRAAERHSRNLSGYRLVSRFRWSVQLGGVRVNHS